MNTIYHDKPSQVLNIPKFTFLLIFFTLGLIGYIKELQIGHYLYTNGIKLERWMLLLPIVLLMALPVLVALWNLLVVSTWSFKITTETLEEKKGVLNVRTDSLELFRVKDISIEEPLLYRVFNLSNVILDTSDKSTPIIKIEAVKNASELVKDLRTIVDQRRTEKGVREADIE